MCADFCTLIRTLKISYWELLDSLFHKMDSSCLPALNHSWPSVILKLQSQATQNQLNVQLYILFVKDHLDRGYSIKSTLETSPLQREHMSDLVEWVFLVKSLYSLFRDCQSRDSNSKENSKKDKPANIFLQFSASIFFALITRHY